MTWKDKLEIGLKENAAFRKDNLPPNEVHGPEIPTGPGRSPEIPLARDDSHRNEDARLADEPRSPDDKNAARLSSSGNVR
jgi:hypothetical protein